MIWLGRKRLALIRVFRPDSGDVIPADWPDQVIRRILYDPQQLDLLGGDRDQSLRIPTFTPFRRDWRTLPGGFSVTIGNPSTVIVPDLFEMNQVSATKLLNSVGLKHAFTGSQKPSAVVFSQNPQAGTVVNKNSIVTMNMRAGTVR
jgi:PASTA domain